MKDISVTQLIEYLPAAFLPEKAQGVEAAIQINVLGEGGGEWILQITQGTCILKAGTTVAPKLTLEASAADILAVIGGTLDPAAAFMAGRLRARGDMKFAFQLANYFHITPQIRAVLNGE